MARLSRVPQLLVACDYDGTIAPIVDELEQVRPVFADLRRLREKLLAAKGIELVVDEVWTPPLADATAIVQKLRSAQPDIMFYGGTNFPDSIQVLQKVKEFSIKTPIQGVGAWLVTPEYVKTVGKELLDNIMTVTAAHPLKGQEALVEKFKKRTGEPFMTQDPLMTYAHVWIIKEAAERAKSADPKAIRDALGWQAGLDLAIERGNDCVVIRRRRSVPRRTVEEVAGSLKYDGPPVSLEDKERAIEAELRERWRRKSR